MPSSRVGGFEELQRKLTWLTVFRTVTTSLLLAVVAARLLSGPPGRELSREDAAAFAVIASAYLLTLVYGFILRTGRVGTLAAYGQVVGDLVLATSLVYVTGGAESPFTFTYSLAVVAASILLLQQGALIAAALSCAAYGLLLALVQTGALHPPYGGSVLAPGRLAFVLGGHVLSQLLIAALAGYLSRQLTAAGGRLSETAADLERLAMLQREILSSMPSGLITCDAQGRVTFVNSAAQALLALEEGAEEQYELETLLPGVSELGAHARRRELVVPTRLGSRTLGLTVTPLEGTQSALLIVFQDLTDLRRMEDALRRADALASLGTLSAQLAHEIRNPLAAMRGSAQMLAEDIASGGAAARLVGIILRESDRLSRLVEDFLRFARPPTPLLQRVELARLVHETVEMMQADPLSAGVMTRAYLEPLEAQVDPDQIRQVVLNLLRNALQAAGPSGEVRVGLTRAGEQTHLSIWDSAGSIPSQDLKRIFEPFVTTRTGGTGLGLSTAHAIIQAHGGTIEVTSNTRSGTRFTVRLPLQHLEVASAHPGR